MTWGIVLVILICVYFGIFHSHRYYGFDLVLWLAIIGTGSIGILDFMWFNQGRWHKLRLFLFMLFIVGPTAALVIFLHNVYVDKQLIGHEITTKGIITKLYVKRGRNSVTPYAVFSYQVNGKTWTQDMKNTEDPLVVGDSVQLVCSELDPEVFLRLRN